MQIWTVSFCNLPVRLDSTVLFLTNYLKNDYWLYCVVLSYKDNMPRACTFIYL
jgi:hypothetical protein